MTLFLLPLALFAAAPQSAPVAETPVAPNAVPGEDEVDPYIVDEANAGARAFSSDGMAKAFHGKPGIQRVVDGLITRVYADPMIGEIFEGHDKLRFGRTLFEQFCYILNAGCDYSGRDMASSHKDLGTQRADMNRVVELLQQSMRDEGISFAAQNRFLSKLAPMRGDIVER